MSSPSKKKGYNGEILVRDYLIRLGYQAKRIVVGTDPVAGSVDVVAHDQDGKEYTFQVKWKAKSFESVYKFYSRFRNEAGVVSVALGPLMVDIADSFLLLTDHGGIYCPPTPEQLTQKRTLNKIMNMQKLVGKSQYLVIKGDHRPLLFLRFR